MQRLALAMNAGGGLLCCAAGAAGVSDRRSGRVQICIPPDGPALFDPGSVHLLVARCV